MNPLFLLGDLLYLTFPCSSNPYSDPCSFSFGLLVFAACSSHHASASLTKSLRSSYLAPLIGFTYLSPSFLNLSKASLYVGILGLFGSNSTLKSLPSSKFLLAANWGLLISVSLEVVSDGGVSAGVPSPLN